MSAERPPVVYSEAVRERWRRRGEPRKLQRTWTKREKPVGVDARLTIPQLALDRYDDIPTDPLLDVWYLPDEHALVIDLPDDSEKQTLEDYTRPTDSPGGDE